MRASLEILVTRPTLRVFADIQRGHAGPRHCSDAVRIVEFCQSNQDRRDILARLRRSDPAPPKELPKHAAEGASTPKARDI